MKLSLRLLSSTSMKFVTPSQYTKSNQAHYIINTTAVNDFIKMNPKLGVNDRVLDFGCGTGETTLAIAQGNLGDLGHPGQVGSHHIPLFPNYNPLNFKVVGVDISEDMISHCQQQHNLPSLSFQKLDVAQGDSFISSNKSSFSAVTSFSCLHWVPDMPATVSLFNKVLRQGGKFVFVVSPFLSSLTHLFFLLDCWNP